MKLPRVIVIVNGGIVQKVLSNEQIDVDVLDYDNFRDPDCEPEMVAAYKRIERVADNLEGMFEVHF